MAGRGSTMPMRMGMLAVLWFGCGAGTAEPEPVEVTQAPAPRLSESAPRRHCAIAPTPAVAAPTADVDVIANIVVRSAAEARVTIDRHTPPGNDPDALFAVAHAETDLYRLEGDAQVLQSAIRHWAQLVQAAPTYAQMDQVLYQLAWGLGAIDQHDRARQVYHRLIQHYPQSALIVVAYIHFGDHFLRERDGVAATRFYERAKEMTPEDDVLTHAYLAYGHAWATSVSGDAVEPEPLERALDAANEPLRAAIETDWCAR